jgi:hypothetical protein
METPDQFKVGDLVFRPDAPGVHIRVEHIYGDGKTASLRVVKQDGTPDRRYDGGYSGILTGYQKVLTEEATK